MSHPLDPWTGLHAPRAQNALREPLPPARGDEPLGGVELIVGDLATVEVGADRADLLGGGRHDVHACVHGE